MLKSDGHASKTDEVAPRAKALAAMLNTPSSILRPTGRAKKEFLNLFSYFTAGSVMYAPK